MLADLSVLDFTTTIAGPHCTRLLADLGAGVLKVEPAEGDLLRHRPPLRQGASSYFGELNAGKRSIVVDLKRPEGVGIARRLAARSDVVVENFRPGVMQRLGLDYETLRAIRSDLVYCAMSGYGQTGPSAGLPAYAPAIHAASGYDLAHLSYQEGRTKPDVCGLFVGDVLLGTYAFGAIMTALYHRRATGQGQMIDVSMLESMLTLTLVEVQRAQFPVDPPGRPMFGPLETRDGYVMLAVGSERTFGALCRAAGHEEWMTDPRFARYPDRRASWHLFLDEVEGWSRQLTTAECQARFERFGVPASPYRTVEETLRDPQLAHRQALAEVRDAGGTFKAVNPPYRFSAARAGLQPFAPALGEHTDEILTAAGYSKEEIGAFRQARVVG
jgi:CoA:oxalate CoA-transferase